MIIQDKECLVHHKCSGLAVTVTGNSSNSLELQSWQSICLCLHVFQPHCMAQSFTPMFTLIHTYCTHSFFIFSFSIWINSHCSWLSSSITYQKAFPGGDLFPDWLENVPLPPRVHCARVSQEVLPTALGSACGYRLHLSSEFSESSPFQFIPAFSK